MTLTIYANRNMMKVIEYASDRKLKAIEKQLRLSKPLKIEGVTKQEMKGKKPLRILMELLDYSITRNTLYTVNGRKQCNMFRRRSQGDIFNIMRYYYPEITFKELRALLFTLINTGRINSGYCENISKRVFMRWPRPADYNHTSGYYAKRNVHILNHISGYSMPDEFNLQLKIIQDEGTPN